MNSFKTYLECSDVKTIQDINVQFDYEDGHPHGVGDSPQVACGQSGSYNELQYIYDTYLKKFVDSGSITEQQAIQALCSACHDLSNPRTREEFYKHLEDELGIKI